MKKFITLILLILISLGAQSVSANKDYPQTNKWSYSCNANGEGTLYLTFGGVDSKNASTAQIHTKDVRSYRIDYPGIVTIYNTNRNYAYADISAADGIKTTGCTKACELGPISGNQIIWPTGWSHTSYHWEWWGSNGIAEGNEYSADAYVFTPNYWPYYIQAISGFTDAGGYYVRTAEGWGETKEMAYEPSVGLNNLVGFGTAAVTFIPDGNGMGNCAKCSSGINPNTIYESIVTPACDNGTVVNPTSSTDGSNKTTYTWSCSSGGGTNASCTAQSKPVTDPPACDETRRVSQCMYSMAGGETLSLGTSDGPTTIGINSTAASLPLYVPGACRAPVAGVKPRVVCDGYSGTIETSLTSFTLPSDVTRKPGKCSVIFDDPGYCYPRSKDTIEIKAKADPSCLGLTETDALKKPECTATVTDKVCIAIKDKYGNPVSKVEADKVTTSLKYVLSATPTNTYYKKNSSIVYVPGTFTEVSPGVVCAPKCDKDHPELCTCQELGTCPPPPPPSCTSTNSCTTCVDNNTCPPPVCIPSAANNNCGDPIVTTITDNTCTPSILNNYCKEPGPVTTVPGGDIITTKKTCTGHIEVWNGTTWTKDGSTILYDEPYDYRIFIDGADPVCSNGVVSLSAIAVTGGAFTGGLAYSAADTFRATITKTSTSTPTTPRGVSVKAVFTQPGGSVLKVIPYGLTADPLDFLDNPLQITGDRMKGVRVIGNTAGTNIGEFNLNNGWVVAEQGPITNAARSTMLQKVALLTRGITPNTVVNGILYIEGDINYSSSIIKSSVFNTLIVRGNLTIDENIGSTTNTDGKGIIILANSTGNGGNIIIGDGVRIIHALIFAEGTLRGVSTLASQLNQSIQLVIKGSLFSRNTIGGSAVSTALYLAGGSKTDDVHAAFIQDLNNVRNGIEYNLDGSPLNPYKGYSDPFIIDYDPALRLLGLPGFTN